MEWAKYLKNYDPEDEQSRLPSFVRFVSKSLQLSNEKEFDLLPPEIESEGSPQELEDESSQR